MSAGAAETEITGNTAPIDYVPTNQGGLEPAKASNVGMTQQTTAVIQPIKVQDPQAQAAANQYGREPVGYKILDTIGGIANAVSDVIDVPRTIEGFFASKTKAIDSAIAKMPTAPSWVAFRGSNSIPTGNGYLTSLGQTPSSSNGWMPLGNKTVHAINGNIVLTLTQAIKLMDWITSTIKKWQKHAECDSACSIMPLNVLGYFPIMRGMDWEHFGATKVLLPEDRFIAGILLDFCRQDCSTYTIPGLIRLAAKISAAADRLSEQHSSAGFEGIEVQLQSETPAMVSQLPVPIGQEEARLLMDTAEGAVLDMFACIDAMELDLSSERAGHFAMVSACKLAKAFWARIDPRLACWLKLLHSSEVNSVDPELLVQPTLVTLRAWNRRMETEARARQLIADTGNRREPTCGCCCKQVDSQGTQHGHNGLTSYPPVDSRANAALPVPVARAMAPKTAPAEVAPLALSAEVSEWHEAFVRAGQLPKQVFSPTCLRPHVTLLPKCTIQGDEGRTASEIWQFECLLLGPTPNVRFHCYVDLRFNGGCGTIGTQVEMTSYRGPHLSQQMVDFFKDNSQTQGKAKTDSLAEYVVKLLNSQRPMMSISFPEAGGWDAVCAQLRNRLLHALNGNVDMLPKWIGNVSNIGYLGIAELIDPESRRRQMADQLITSEVVNTPGYYNLDSNRQYLSRGEMTFVPMITPRMVNAGAGAVSTRWMAPVIDIRRHDIGPGVPVQVTELPKVAESQFMLQPTPAISSLVRSNNATISWKMLTDAVSVTRSFLPFNNKGCATWQPIARLESLLQGMCPFEGNILEKNVHNLAFERMGTDPVAPWPQPRVAATPAASVWSFTVWPFYKVPAQPNDQGVEHDRLIINFNTCTAGDYWAYLNGTLGAPAETQMTAAYAVPLSKIIFVPFQPSEAADWNAVVMKCLSHADLPWPFANTYYKTGTTYQPDQNNTPMTVSTLVAAPSCYAWPPNAEKIVYHPPAAGAPDYWSVRFCLVDVTEHRTGGPLNWEINDPIVNFFLTGGAGLINRVPASTVRLWTDPAAPAGETIEYRDGGLPEAGLFMSRFEEGAALALDQATLTTSIQNAIQSYVKHGYLAPEDIKYLERWRTVTAAFYAPNPVVFTVPDPLGTGRNTFNEYKCGPALVSGWQPNSMQQQPVITANLDANVSQMDDGFTDIFTQLLTDALGVRSTRTINRGAAGGDIFPKTAGAGAYIMPFENEQLNMAIACGIFARKTESSTPNVALENQSGEQVTPKLVTTWSIDRSDTVSVVALRQNQMIAAAIDLTMQTASIGHWQMVRQQGTQGNNPIKPIILSLEPVINGNVFGATPPIMVSLVVNGRPDGVLDAYYAALNAPQQFCLHNAPCSRTLTDSLVTGEGFLGLKIDYEPQKVQLSSLVPVVAGTDNLGPAVNGIVGIHYKLGVDNAPSRLDYQKQSYMRWIWHMLEPLLWEDVNAAWPPIAGRFPKFYQVAGLNTAVKMPVYSPRVLPAFAVVSQRRLNDIVPPLQNIGFTNGYRALMYYAHKYCHVGTTQSLSWYAIGMQGVLVQAFLYPPAFSLPNGAKPVDLNEVQNTASINADTLLASIFGGAIASEAEADVGRADTKNE